MQQQPPAHYESSGVQQDAMHSAAPAYYTHTVQQLSQQQYYAAAPLAMAVQHSPQPQLPAGVNQQHGVGPTLRQSSDTITALATSQGGGPNAMSQCFARPPPPLPAATDAMQLYNGGAPVSTGPASTSGGAGDLGSLLCQLADYGSASVGASTSAQQSATMYQAAASVPVSSAAAPVGAAVGAQPAASGGDNEIQSASDKFRQVLQTMGVDNASIQSMQSSLVVALKDRNTSTGPAAEADAAAPMSVESSLHAIAVGMTVGAAVDTLDEAKQQETERQHKLDEVKEAYDKLVDECKKFKSELEKTKDKNHRIRKSMRGSKAKTSPLLETNLQLQHTVKQQLNLQLDLKGRLKSLKEFREKQLQEAQDKVKLLKQQQQKSGKKTSSRRSSKKHKSAKKSKRRSAESDDGEVPPPAVKYVDGGGHRCDACGVTCHTVFDYCNHLHTELHRMTIKAAYRPWCTESHAVGQPAGDGSNKVKSMHIKGVDYLVPCLGYYCTLCETFAGDLICAEEHLKTEAHHNAFKARLLATMNNGVGEDVADTAQPQTVDAQDQQQFYVDDLNLVVKNSHNAQLQPLGPPLPDDHRRLVHESASGRRLQVQLQMGGRSDYGGASSSARPQQQEHEVKADRDYRTTRYPAAGAGGTSARNHTDSKADDAHGRSSRRRHASSPDAEPGRFTSSGHASGAQHAALPVLSKTQRALSAIDQRQLIDCLQRKAQGVESTQDRELRYRLQRKAEYLTRDNERRH